MRGCERGREGNIYRQDSLSRKRGEEGERELEGQQEGEEEEKKKKKTDAFHLRTCHISGMGVGGMGMGGQAGQRKETHVLLTTAKLSSTTRGHFSGTFLQVQVQKELAGGVVNLFPM